MKYVNTQHLQLANVEEKPVELEQIFITLIKTIKLLDQAIGLAVLVFNTVY